MDIIRDLFIIFVGGVFGFLFGCKCCLLYLRANENKTVYEILSKIKKKKDER